ncbi:Nuclear speckle splicing regulatory protein 1-like protein [Zalerion maritima]|uniref:Nuclear speckle splicing regulatory protein 1-like protein n=1 Tax=Zalerion maritima TaxID=339359 RepID=A0AAD5WXB3_9PEZI|nr:Nuclear speckle splicing regulatory protein 1-like protein [Zalerion maritima]
MSKPGFSMGFKPKSIPSRGPAKPKAKPSRVVFRGSDDDSDDGDNNEPQPSAFSTKSRKGKAKSTKNSSSPKSTAITEFDIDSPTPEQPSSSSSSKHGGSGLNKLQKKTLPPTEPPSLKSKSKSVVPKIQSDMSSSLTSRKHLQEAESVDPTIFDYDGVYDTIKQNSKPSTSSNDPNSNNSNENGSGEPEKSSRYLTSLITASSVRTRDRQIAEEKKIARERAAEGDMYADKEKFVTAAYKKQQEENARMEEEEKRREEEEAKKNASGGMSGFYKNMLQEDEKRHERMVKAAEEATRGRKEREARGELVGGEGDRNEGGEDEKEETEADIARRINAMGGSIMVNEDGEVVDKRELLRGGLNIAAKKKIPLSSRKSSSDSARTSPFAARSSAFRGQGGGKGAMRERQSRMIEEQLSQQLKRSLQKDDEEKNRVERAAKSRKTEGDIMSAKERYLARKKAAEEAKKQGLDPL